MRVTSASPDDVDAALARLRQAGAALRKRPARQTLDALCALLDEWRRPDSPWRRRLEEGLPRASGFSRETVRAIRLQSPIFTPNGDGVNDAAHIQYELLNVDRVPVVIEVYDLAGRKVAEVIDGERTSGRFRATWDGRGADGELMPPGTYLLHLVVETDGGRETARRVVGLAY